jgi:hypothetical protein
MTRRTAVLATASVVVVLAIAVGVWRASHTGGYRSAIESVRVGAGDHELIVVVGMANCERLDRIEVSEDASRVRLAAFVLGSSRCSGVDLTQARDIPIRLKAPLGTRVIVERDHDTPIHRTDS